MPRGVTLKSDGNRQAGDMARIGLHINGKGGHTTSVARRPDARRIHGFQQVGLQFRVHGIVAGLAKQCCIFNIGSKFAIS